MSTDVDGNTVVAPVGVNRSAVLGVGVRDNMLSDTRFLTSRSREVGTTLCSAVTSEVIEGDDAGPGVDSVAGTGREVFRVLVTGIVDDVGCADDLTPVIANTERPGETAT